MIADVILENVTHLEEERRSYGGKQTGLDKRPGQCKHCERNNHISKKCWKKFDRPEWAQLVDIDSPIPGDGAHVSSSAPSSSFGSSTVVLSRDEYDRKRQLDFFQPSHSMAHASFVDPKAHHSSFDDD